MNFYNRFRSKKNRFGNTFKPIFIEPSNFLLKVLDDFNNTSVSLEGPSEFWKSFNKKNLDQLLETGLENFKRSVSFNYFTWITDENDIQIQSLQKILVPSLLKHHHKQAKKDCACIEKVEGVSMYAFSLLTRLLFDYALTFDSLNELSILEEPLLGNPIPIARNGKIISQDLANSFLEKKSIEEGFDLQKEKAIFEIGAGSGRTAFLLLKTFPFLKYYIVDIPPAILVSFWYLKNLFPEKKILYLNDKIPATEINQKISENDIIFCLPKHLKLIPDKSVSLGITISSLGEMTNEQIKFYLDHMNRILTSGFYLKQWESSKNPFDNLIINIDQYPIPANWQALFLRPVPHLPLFKEALFSLNRSA